MKIQHAAPLALIALLDVVACATTGHPVVAAATQAASTRGTFEDLVDVPGPVLLETIVSANWHVSRAGLVNLKDPQAKEAGLVDGEEPIQLLFHALRHPTEGLVLVDTGAERALRDDPSHALIHGLVGRLAHVADLHVQTATGDWLAQQHEPVRAVLLTHLHLDHVTGMRDVPAAATVYVGPGEAQSRAFMNVVSKGIVDRALHGKAPLRELHFVPDRDGAFAGVLDVFGDQTVWALWVPGHTPGSLAFLVRTPTGPVLLTGDACHTAWGWEHGVPPGTFSEDLERSSDSLARLERFAARHPGMTVRLGHQPLPAAVAHPAH